MEENRIPKRVLYMNLETTRLRGRPRNRWQDKVREDGRIVGGEGWQEKKKSRIIRPLKEVSRFHVYVVWYDICMVRCIA